MCEVLFLKKKILGYTKKFVIFILKKKLFYSFFVEILKKKEIRMNNSGFAMTFYYTVLVILISTNFSVGNDGKYYLV